MRSHSAASSSGSLKVYCPGGGDTAVRIR